MELTGPESKFFYHRGHWIQFGRACTQVLPNTGAFTPSLPYILRTFRQCPQNTLKGNWTVVSSYQATQFNDIISVVPLQYNLLILPDLFIQIGIQNSLLFYPPTVVYTLVIATLWEMFCAQYTQQDVTDMPCDLTPRNSIAMKVNYHV